MAATSGRQNSALAETLFAEGHRFDFFQAIRLLEQLFPNRSRLGHANAPAGEPVQIHSRAALAFAASSIDEIRPGDHQAPAQMSVSFLGLTGPVGVLPRHYTELVLERRKDAALRSFLDLFTHRAAALFYRAWSKYHFVIEFEATLRRGRERDQLAHYLCDLFGMGTGGLAHRLKVPDHALPFYAGLLSQQRRSAAGLKALLEHYLDTDVVITQFLGEWLPIAAANRTRLGRTNHALGVSAIAGGWCWDQQAGFEVCVGPLPWQRYSDFLPDGRAFPALVQLTRYFAGQEHEFGVRLSLRADEVPACALGSGPEGSGRLGYSAWLGTRDSEQPAEDARFGARQTALGMLPS